MSSVAALRDGSRCGGSLRSAIETSCCLQGRGDLPGSLLGAKKLLSRLLDWLATRSDGRYRGEIYRTAELLSGPIGVPQHLLVMLFIIEDKRYGRHSGIDLVAVLRAVICNLAGRGSLQGASTVTQQLYDVVRLIDDKSYLRQRTFSRKLDQAFWAVKKEVVSSKEEILHQYLNNVYWGADYFGIDAAAAGYFGCAKDSLTVAQAFFLAERLASPNVNCPSRVVSLLNRPAVIDLMVEQEISIEELRNIYLRWSLEMAS